MSTLVRLTTFLAIWLPLVLPGLAASLDEAESHYKQGNYEKALMVWLELAEQGESEAQYRLSELYDRGFGTPEDDRLAIEWLTKAAEQAHAAALDHLAIKYSLGVGVPQDKALGLHWHLKAAEMGNLFSQLDLWRHYRHLDPIEARKWLMRAAEQGNATSQHLLGDSLEKGDGLPQDRVQAYMWHYLVIVQDQSDPKCYEQCRRALLRLAEDVSPEEIVEARRLAVEWLDRRSKPGL